jgi:predicted nucleic acid-binding protein
VTIILDSGGVSALAGARARIAELRRRGQWPPQLPTAVLVETLTGDHRKDFHVNQLIQLCQVREVTDSLARAAAGMRTRTGRASSISAVDAIVAALATRYPDSVVLTSDPDDIKILVADGPVSVSVVGV